MLSKWVLYYGKDEPPAEQIDLHAGSLSLSYEQGDLRYVRLGNREILRRLYVAVRDRNWGTVAPAFSNVNLDVADDSFLITYDVANRQNEIDFAWKGVIQGKADGTLSFSIDGEARSTFWRNRIGFCILLPAFLAGTTGQVEHLAGEIEPATFPIDFVSSQPVTPFADMKQVSYPVMPDVWADVEFSGDVFEMEDQRNWTDASFKVFCTPLRLPYPVQVQKGTRVHQSVVVRLCEGQPAAIKDAVQTRLSQDTYPVIRVDRTAREIPLPKLGLGMGSEIETLDTYQIDRLRAMNLDHLRVDLRLNNITYSDVLRLAVEQAAQLRVKLEIALLVSDRMEEEFEGLCTLLDEIRPHVSAWLCYPEKELFMGGSATAQVVRAARDSLADYDPSIPFCAGTNTDFIFMKRTIPPINLIQGICFATNPQAHAFDNASLMETLEQQGAAVENARRLGGTLPVIVSPVTLKPRFNPYATGSAPALLPGELPPQVDVRQMSLFGASWTVGSFKYIAEAAAHSVTYYETIGWQGVMETAIGSSLPDVFHSFPRCVYPIYHVLADVGEFHGGSLLPVHTNLPLQASGLLLRKGKKERMLVANHTGSIQHLRIGGLQRSLSVHTLDETNVLRAMQSPEQYRHSAGLRLEPQDSSMQLDILPYAVAKIDTE